MTKEQIELLLTNVRKFPGITFADYTVNSVDDVEEIMINYDSDKLLQTLNISFFVDQDKIEYSAICLDMSEENLLDDFSYSSITNLDYQTIVKFITDCEKFIVENYGDYSTKEGQLKIINNELAGVEMSVLINLSDFIDLPEDFNHKVFELLDKLHNDVNSIGNIFLKDRDDLDANSCIDEIMETLHYDNGKPLTTDEYNYFDHYDRDQDRLGFITDEVKVDHFKLNSDSEFCVVLNMTYENLKDELTLEYDGSSWEHDFGNRNEEEDPLDLNFD